jgi:hypothetical protein
MPVRLTDRHKQIVALAWGVLVAAVIAFLALRIWTTARHVPVVESAFSDCRPHPRAFADASRLHHTLAPCTVFVEREVIIDGGREQLEYEAAVRVNSLGFRNDEYPLEKAAGATRILVFGDSFAYGLGLPIERTFVKLLERRLAAKTSRRVEVWNLAVISWSTTIHANLAEDRLREADPDLVIVSFDDSDFYDNAAYREELAGSDRFAPDPSGMDAHWKRRERWVRRTMAEEKTDAGVTVGEALHELGAREVLRIQRALAPLGRPLVVMTHPYPDFPESYEREFLERFYARLRPAGVEVLSLYPEFPKSERDRCYFPKNRHWNEAGSEKVAARLEAYLLAKHPALFPPKD